MTKKTPAIAQRLVAVRKDAGLSQRALAAKSGVSFSYISRIEQGQRTASLETIRQLAEALEISPHYLETGDTEGDYVYRQKGGK